MADELSLLWKLRADVSQTKTATAEARAAVAQLRQSLGPELTQTVSVTNKAFSQIADNLNVFVGQRLPLVGGAFVRVTENIRGFGDEAKKQEQAIKKVADSISDLSTRTGKSVPQLTSFLTTFAKIEGQANRDSAALKFFGAEFLANNPKLVNELEKTSTGLSEIALASAGARTGIAAMAAPIGIAVVALGAMALGAAAVVKQLFELTKQAADFQGRMIDLAQQTGVQVETLSALEIVARRTGGSLDNMTQALVGFQRKLDDAQDPLSKTADLFREYSIDINDTESALRGAFTALAAMPTGFAQTNAAAELFGARGGKQVLAILKETNGDLDGTIKKFRELGILITDDAALAADKFNDELELLNFQLRALTAVAAKDLIPAVTEIIKSFGDLVTAARPLISIFGAIAGSAARGVSSAFRGLRIVVASVTGDYIALAKAAKEANEAIKATPIPALKIPGTQPIPLPLGPTSTQAAEDAVANADVVVAAAKRAAEKTNQALDELFQQGRRNREQQANELIAANKKVLDAERERITALLKLKDEEVKGLRARQDLSASEQAAQIRETFEAAQKLQEELRNKENQFEVESDAIRLKTRIEAANSRRNQLANETDNLVTELDNQIKNIEAAVKRGDQAESEGLTTIELLEQEKINVRRRSLEDQKDVGFLTIQAQEELNDQLQKLNQEADRLEDEQRNRRLARERETAERNRDILIASLDTLLEVERVQGEARIATLESLAALRVKTEEDAAKETLRIRLQLIDSEIEATKAKLTAAGSITDVGERTKAEAELNNQLKILNAQRVAIQQQGNRGIDDARQRDLNNARAYTNDLNKIQQRIVDIERDTAEEALRLMALHFASRRELIRARLQLDIEDEEARHRNAQQGIDALRQENAEAKRTREEKLRIDKEINALSEAEAERHRLALEGIRRKGRLDEKEASPLGRLDLDIDNLKEFAATIEESIVPLGGILQRTFLQVADAIGQTVANWVLLGETGPAVMRKILAQALAALAAEAAVNAIKELALGFAMLFINPAESGAHFTAAALWASIGGVAAIAGRGVAGDLFKPKTASSGGGSSAPRPLDTVVEQGRNQRQPPVVHINITHAEGMIVKTVVDDFNNGGLTRETIQRD